MPELIRRFARKTEPRESRDEIVLGEVVRAMARLGHPTIGLETTADRLRLRFLTVRHPVLSSVWITLDRRSGAAVGDTLLASTASLEIAAETERRIAEPDGLVRWSKAPAAPRPAGSRRARAPSSRGSTRGSRRS